MLANNVPRSLHDRSIDGPRIGNVFRETLVTVYKRTNDFIERERRKIYSKNCFRHNCGPLLIFHAYQQPVRYHLTKARWGAFLPCEYCPRLDRDFVIDVKNDTNVWVRANGKHTLRRRVGKKKRGRQTQLKGTDERERRPISGC